MRLQRRRPRLCQSSPQLPAYLFGSGVEREQTQQIGDALRVVFRGNGPYLFVVKGGR